MELTDQEQYLLELINRARLDPEGTAALYGIDLNADLAPGTLDGTAKQVLAPNDLLKDAAEAHSAWMLETDTFNHKGAGGSSSRQRMEAAGYGFTPPSASGENIAYVSTRATPTQSTEDLHRNLFLSAGHRENILFGMYAEIGLGLLSGSFTNSAGNTFNAEMLTENYAVTATRGPFLTGVAHGGSDGYLPGSGIAGITFTIGLASARTGAAGGYVLEPAAGGAQTVTLADGSGFSASAEIGFGAGNAKLDLVGLARLESSADLTLIGGIDEAGLLGVAGLSLTGNGADNLLEGNAGDNLIRGGKGNDTLAGGGGMDTLIGGEGNDVLRGGADGTGWFEGGPGHDVLIAGPGGARLDGGSGRDTLEGGAGHDTVLGGDGPDIARLRHGDDSYTDTAQGGPLGGDSVDGGAGNDTIASGGGADTLIGGPGEDELRGGDGDDLIRGGDGQDRIFGEAGNDTIVADGDSSAYTRPELIRGGDGDDLVQITGSSGNSALRSIIYLDNGNDRLEQLESRSSVRVYAGNGDDTLLLNTGQEAFGGAGNDRIEARGWLTADGGDGADTIISLIGTDDITGGNGRDFVRMGTDHDIFRDSYQGGANGADTVLGEDGNDTIIGGGGNDLFKGQRHADLISGGAGHDTIEGGPGKDTLAGGNGDDLLTGGSERDQFIFRPGTGHDRITDYETGIDILRFDRGFWGAGNEPETGQFVADHARVSGGDVVIALADISVTLEGLTSTAGLAEDMVYI